MIGQCRRKDNVASLRVLLVQVVSKPDLLLVVATRFAVRDNYPVGGIVLSYSLRIDHGQDYISRRASQLYQHVKCGNSRHAFRRLALMTNLN